MSTSADDIYALLPAIHRTRDADAGGPLRDLIGAIAEQAGVLDDNIRALYADLFIETCSEWVIPYIGDLIGWRGLFTGIPGVAGSRSEVANTIGYRRRKGTPIALEQIAHDVTGRPARAVEYFRRLVTNQSMQHLRPDNAACADLRDGAAMARIGGAFDTLNRTIDVRRIAPRTRTPSVPDTDPLEIALHGGGRFNIPDIGLFLWRLRPYAVQHQPASQVDARRFLFSPLAAPMQLFNAPPLRVPFASRTERVDVPHPIGRREFHDDPARFYGANASLLVTIDGNPVPVTEICVCALDDFAGAWPQIAAGKVAIDPLLGRLALATNRPSPKNVRVSYNYGFPFDLGGGPYDRTAALKLPSAFVWQAIIGHDAPNLEAAVAGFNAQPDGSTGLIVCPDFDILPTGAAAIRLPASSRLWIVAAHNLPGGGWIPTDARPTLQGDLGVHGAGGPAQAAQPGSLVVSGLMLAGSLLFDGAAITVALQDCTLVPGQQLTRTGLGVDPRAPSIILRSPGTALSLDRCIAGPIFIDPGATLRITGSIVDAGSAWNPAIAAPDGAGEAGQLHVEDSTIVGKVRTHLIELASNTIFLARLARHDPWQAALWATRRQSGCVRFCVVPTEAITPAQYRCLSGDAAEPKFVSLQYGHPAYLLLSCDCPVAVWQGADDESQIGAYHALYEPQGVANVQTRLAEYLPFGLEAGVFLIPCRPEPASEPDHYTTRTKAADDDDPPHGIAVGGMLI